MKEIRVALIGHKFMGRAHTHGYTDLPIFFDPGVKVVKKVLCANEADVNEVAKRWGWEEAVMDWHDVVKRDDIDLIDIAASNSLHAPIAIAAAHAGKHVFCEKPLALSLEQAEEMVKAVEEAGVVNMIGFNYRKVPALALAKQMISGGKLGEIYHFRGIYQQDWLISPNFPCTWRLQKDKAGFGSVGDLGIHVIDVARFLIGDISEVTGMAETFITDRPEPAFVDGLIAEPGEKMVKVDVDDATAFLARFKNRNTLGYFEMTRYGAGHRNQNRIEINGSKGTIIFDMEQMNELQLYKTDDSSWEQGFRRIQVGEGVHPYMQNWWPCGHIIGYGETFVNQAYDLIKAIQDGSKVSPDFRDGLMAQKVVDAVDKSTQNKKWEKVAD
jgi:predicted dehydrogenase